LCALLVIILALSIGGCATAPEPFDYPPDHELKKGPGLFSGEEGAFTIYRKPAPADEVSEAGEKK